MLSLSLSLPATAMELYDSFDSRLLKPALWNSGWVSPHALDVQRYIDSGSLRLGLLGVGSQDAETGRTIALNDVAFPEAVAVDLRTVEMTVVLNKTSAKSCKADGTPSYARFRHWGRWFNDGSSTGPDDETGDFHSFLEIRKVAGAEANEIRFYAYRCLDSDCTTFESPITGSTWLADAPVGTPVKLRTVINEDSGVIRFKAVVKDRAPVSRSFDFSSMVSVVKPPSKPGYAHVLQARVDAANCDVSARKLPTGLIDASIQQIRIRRAASASEAANGSVSSGDDTSGGAGTDNTIDPEDGAPVFAPVSGS